MSEINLEPQIFSSLTAIKRKNRLLLNTTRLISETHSLRVHTRNLLPHVLIRDTLYQAKLSLQPLLLRFVILAVFISPNVITT